MLLHDLGKPAVYSEVDGCGHFYGHAVVSRRLADDVLRRLKYDNETREAVLMLVERHDAVLQPTEKSVRRALRTMGETGLRRFLEVKRADNQAQAPAYAERQTEIDSLEVVMRELLERDACFSLKQLAVNGRDLMAIGLRGREIGAELERLLSAVVDGYLPNQKEILMENAAMGVNAREPDAR